MGYIKRTLSKELLLSAKEYPIVAVLGPRQSGKATLVKTCFPRKAYVSFEDLETRDFAIRDPRGLLKTYVKGAIFDEIQRVPSLLSYLQTEVDQQNTSGRFILTGSNQYMLQEKITQSLAGRIALLKLLPLSFIEIQNSFKGKKRAVHLSLNQLLFKGCYPKLYASSIRSKKWLGHYIQTYVDKDVRLIKNIENLHQFNIFLKIIATRVGQMVNLVSIGNDCGLAQNTVKSWLSILESSYIIKLIYPYYRNFGKRLIKTPKVYFLDTGLLCYLLGIQSSRELTNHPLQGFIFESWVFSELEKSFCHRGQTSPLFFWRHKNGYEIDFIIDRKPKETLIEVKLGKTINQSFFKNIQYYKRFVKNTPSAYLLFGGKDKQNRSIATALPWDQIKELLHRKQT